MLLFNVVRTGYRVAEKLYDSFVARTGRSDETLNALQSYTERHAAEKGSQNAVTPFRHQNCFQSEDPAVRNCNKWMLP